MRTDTTKLPYFKFMVQDWLSGDIQSLDLETQAIFINLVALMWKDGGVYSKPIGVLLFRCGFRPDQESKLMESLDMLKELGIIYVDEKGYMRVKFIDEQLAELTQDHEQKVVAGKLGAKKRWGKQSHGTAIAPLYHTDTESDTELDTDITPKACDEQKRDAEKKPKSKPETWKTSYEIYLTGCREALAELQNDTEFIKLQEKFHPDVDIRLSLEKAFFNFWGTEAGWKHKKKSRTADLDWVSTFRNAIDKNRVFKPKQSSTKRYNPSSVLG